jgi:TonB family protein
MVARTASGPPLFGPADLKARARTFLERALVVSALIHLSIVGAFRAAEERAAARAGHGPPSKEERVHTIDVLIPAPPPPVIVHGGAGSIQGEGEVVPVPRPVIDVFAPGRFHAEPAGVPADPGGPDIGVDKRLEPPRDLRTPYSPVDTPPVPLVAPKPAYSDWLREARIEGKVLLHVLVGADGFVKEVVVASGQKGLGEEAAKAVRRWTFKPGLSNGRPVEVWVEIPISFQLGE